MDSLGHRVTGPASVTGPAHADRPWPAPARLVAVAAGGAAIITAIGLGVAGCLTAVGSSRSTPTSASLITVTPSAPVTP